MFTKSLRSTTRQSCLQISKFFSKGVRTSLSFSSSLARLLRHTRKACLSLSSSSSTDISGVHGGLRGTWRLPACKASSFLCCSLLCSGAIALPSLRNNPNSVNLKNEIGKKTREWNSQIDEEIGVRVVEGEEAVGLVGLFDNGVDVADLGDGF